MAHLNRCGQNWSTLSIWGSAGAGTSYANAGADAAHDSFKVKLPRSVSWRECHADDHKCKLDDHDLHVISLFQSWLPREAANVLTECDPVMPPTSDFHLSFFANYVLDGVETVLFVMVHTESFKVQLVLLQQLLDFERWRSPATWAAAV